MIKNRTIGAIAILSLGFCLPLHAGSIKGSFTTTTTGSWTNNPTSSPADSGSFPPSPPSSLNIQIFQKKKDVSKIILTEKWADGTNSANSTTTFYLVSRNYFAATSSSVVSFSNSSTSFFADGGTAQAKVRVSKARGKKRGGKVSVTLKALPYLSKGSLNSGNRTWLNASEVTHSITAALGKRSNMSYRRVSTGRDSYSHHLTGTSTSSYTTVTSGAGKAIGKLSL